MDLETLCGLWFDGRSRPPHNPAMMVALLFYDQMREALASERGSKLYRERQPIIEPVRPNQIEPRRDAKAARAVFALNSAIERLGAEAARRWIAGIEEQTARAAFCAALTSFVVVGTVRD
jgi:predicted component of type VI protein secretion system